MPTTTVIDTIHHVVYDTIHTSVYDTIHSVSFDTVKVVLDSTFTIDLLNKSQEFYSSSFNWLLGVAAIAAAIFIFVATIAWERKVKIELDKLRIEFDSMANEAAEKSAKKAAEESSKKFENAIAQQRVTLNEMKKDSLVVWHEMLMDLFLSAYKDKNPVSIVGKLNTLVLKISNRPDNMLLDMVRNDIMPLYERALKSLEMAKNFDKVVQSLSDGLELLKRSITSHSADVNLKNDTLRSIENVVALMNELVKSYRKVQSECDAINDEISKL